MSLQAAAAKQAADLLKIKAENNTKLEKIKRMIEKMERSLRLRRAKTEERQKELEQVVRDTKNTQAKIDIANDIEQTQQFFLQVEEKQKKLWETIQSIENVQANIERLWLAATDIVNTQISLLKAPTEITALSKKVKAANKDRQGKAKVVQQLETRQEEIVQKRKALKQAKELLLRQLMALKKELPPIKDFADWSGSEEGNTSAHYYAMAARGCETTHRDLITYETDIVFDKIMGLDINQKNSEGLTALHIAAGAPFDGGWWLKPLWFPDRESKCIPSTYSGGSRSVYQR
jgi:hypothetical protein